MRFKTLFLLVIMSSALWVTWALFTSPSPSLLKGCLQTTMYQVALCPEGSSYSRLSEISPVLVQTILASEDSSFYTHKGFDWFEIKQSLKRNIESQKVSRGGSTITQQLVKNVFLSGEKTLSRKIREAYLTWQVERLYTKNQILERYLNVIELGPNIFGVKAAAKHYFSKLPSQINLLEAAYLAHLLPNPKVYSRTFNKGQLTPYSRQRLRILFSRLYHFGKISQQQTLAAQSLIDDFPWKSLTSGQHGTMFTLSPEESLPEDNEGLDRFVEGPFSDIPPEESTTDSSDASEESPPPPAEEQEDDFE